MNKELNNVLVSIGKTLIKALESFIDAINKLEPYQRYELLHPRKKPRGSIRRARKRGMK